MTSRRDVLAALSTLPFAGFALPAWAQQASRTMPARRFSATEQLPVIGLGGSKVIEESAKHGSEPMRQVLRALVAGRNATRLIEGSWNTLVAQESTP